MELVIFIGWLVTAGVAASIASSKGRGGCAWFGLGFLFGPIAVLLALILPADQGEIERRRVTAGTAIRCRHCQELVSPKATRCPHCQGEGL